MRYETFLVADEQHRRGYRERQLVANDQNAGLYIEFHLNAKEYDKPGIQDNPATVLVTDRAHTSTQTLAKDFAASISAAFKFPNGGLVVRKAGDRAYYNLFYVKAPAILIEPLYVSDKEQAALAMTESGQKKIAQILRDCVVRAFPLGVKIACSLGHKFKPAPQHFDRGAPLNKDVPNPQGLAEADLAEKILGFFREEMASLK